MAKHAKDGSHDSSKTSSNPQSGHGGKHSTDRHPNDGRRTDASKLTSRGWPNPGRK